MNFELQFICPWIEREFIIEEKKFTFEKINKKKISEKRGKDGKKLVTTNSRSTSADI